VTGSHRYTIVNMYYPNLRRSSARLYLVNEADRGVKAVELPVTWNVLPRPESRVHLYDNRVYPKT
jgi:hypothetical protein